MLVFAPVHASQRWMADDYFADGVPEVMSLQWIRGCARGTSVAVFVALSFRCFLDRPPPAPCVASPGQVAEGNAL